ncbi:MAG: AMP-binding protein [Actinomycetales bacterium]
MTDQLRTARTVAPVFGPGVLDALDSALDGTGSALIPSGTQPGSIGESGAHDTRPAGGTLGPESTVVTESTVDPAGATSLLPSEVALALATSGSTGPPRLVGLTAASLLASAHATHARIGPPGRWLLALPLTHVAGWQVLVRSLLSGRAPVAWPAGESFSADVFADLMQPTSGSADGAARVEYAALVPTQLGRLLADPRATAALSGITVLLGGAPAPGALLEAASAAGVRVVTSYGSTETSGGCVYDGKPLDGVRARLEADGRLALGGAVVAAGYLSTDRRTLEHGDAFSTAEGERWFHTADLGRIDNNGSVRVLGRADDVIVTGGEKVNPAAVEAILGADVVIAGLPDRIWGQRVVAVTSRTDADLSRWRALVREHLPAHCAPREVIVVPRLPMIGIGKIDRRAVVRGLDTLRP